MALFDFLNKPKSILSDIAERSGLGFLLERLKPTLQKQYSPQSLAETAFAPYGFYKRAPEIGRTLQKTTLPFADLPEKHPALTAGMPALGVPSVVQGMARSYGRTLERTTTPTGRQELLESGKRIAQKPFQLKTLEEPAFEAALDIPDFLPGGFLAAPFMGGLKTVGKEAIEKGAKELGEKAIRETAEKGVEELLPKAGGEIVEKAMKERGFVKTVKEAATTVPEVAEKVEGLYEPITNVETLETAKRVIKENYDLAKQRVFKESLSAETSTIGQEIMSQAQKAGRFDEAIEMAETLAKKGTEVGQAVQSLSIWSRLTPEGMLRYAAKQMDTAKETMGPVTTTLRKIFGKEMPKITPDDAKYITDIMGQANKATSEADKARLSRLALERVSDKIPWGVSDIIDTYRYNNMLSGPLTHLRNAWNNLINTFVAKPGAMVAEGRPIEAAKYELGAIKAFPDAIDSFVKTFKGEEILDLTKKVDIREIKGKKAPLAISWPTRAMEASDKFFSTLIQAGEEARGATKEQAHKAAEYWLYRQDLSPKEQGYLLNALDNIPKGLYHLRKVPFAGWTIPFVRTPFNFAKMWLEFSPMGFATIPGASNKRTQMGKALVGSMVSLVGLKAALEGRTTWSAPTTEKEKELFYATGRKPFSVLIQGKWVPMATFGPLAWAVALPAAWQYIDKETRTALTDEDYVKAAKTVSSLVNFWSQSTPMEGLGSFVRLIEGDVDISPKRIIARTASQFKPFVSLSRYITNIIDPIYRRPKTFGEEMMADIPFLSKGIKETYTEPTGMPSERNIWQYITPYGLGEDKRGYKPLLKEYQQERQLKYLQQKEKEEEEGWGGKAPVFKPTKGKGSPTKKRSPLIMK